jgi:hypothetical protein
VQQRNPQKETVRGKPKLAFHLSKMGCVQSQLLGRLMHENHLNLRVQDKLKQHNETPLETKQSKSTFQRNHQFSIKNLPATKGFDAIPHWNT